MEQAKYFDSLGFNVLRFIDELFKKYSLCEIKGDIYIYKSNQWKKISEKDLKKLAMDMFPKEGIYRWQKKYQDMYFDAIKTQIKTEAELNLFNYKLNFDNKVYNFNDLMYEGHNKVNYFTSTTGYSIVEDGINTPIFDKFIDEISCGDRELQKYILYWMSYMISGHKKLQKFFILKGSGANGKSTLINLIRKLIGHEHVASISLKRLDERFALSSAVGKKLIIASENESKKEVSTETIKLLTGDDYVEVEQKYKDSYSTKLQVEIIFAINNNLQFSENSLGLRRRLVVIPFNYQVKDEELDLDLDEKLNSELPSIALKLINIYSEFAKEGYKLPNCSKVEKTTKEFLDIGIKESLGEEIFDYFEYNIQIDVNGEIEKNAMYNDFINKNGIEINQTKFWLDFYKWAKHREIKIGKKQNKVRLITGVLLKEEKEISLKGIL